MVAARMVPEDFARMTMTRQGEVGRAWLERLPAILTGCAERWGLTLGVPMTPLSYNFVIPARRADGTEAILKVCVPNGEYARQVAALGRFDGRGSVRLLDSDAGDAALLLERCVPGTLLRRMAVVEDERATSIACDVMRLLWRTPGGPFPAMAEWNDDLRALRPYYGGGTGPFPAAIVDEVERLADDLSASAPAPFLLHGDLHHDNILAAGRAPWLAIDPKGLIGEPAYEAGVLLFNPRPLLRDAPDPARLLARRVDQLAEELAVDRARIRGWGLVRAVLSAWWDVEEYGAPSPETLGCAELLAAIRA